MLGFASYWFRLVGLRLDDENMYLSLITTQHGATINAVDSNGHTPLFRACESGKSEVVLALLQHGASVELLDKDGQSCLHWAASGGHDFILTTLLHHGLEVNVLDENK